MAEEKRRKYDGKINGRAVILARERQNVAQAARELGIAAAARPNMR